MTENSGSGMTAKFPGTLVIGKDGKDGGYYRVSAEQVDSETLRFSFTPSAEGMAVIQPVDVTLPVGPKGPEGEVDPEEVQQFVEEYLAKNPPKAETEQPDWNANEGEPGHVLNRTHYAGTVVVGPTFDGDLSGRNYVGMDGTYLVKVSDQIPTVEELTGATVAGNMGGTDSTLTLTADMILDASAEGSPAIICVYQEITMVWCAKENLTISEGVDLTPGTWFIYAPGQFYVKSLSCLEDNDYTKDILKQLDEKFIPDTIARKTEIPDIPSSDWNAGEGEAGYILNRTHWTDVDGTVHKLDNKYINAEWMAVKESVDEEVEWLPETAVNFTSTTSAKAIKNDYTAAFMPGLEPGQQVTVIWDGTEYYLNVKQGVSDSYLWFGNGSLYTSLTGSSDNTGEPFCCARYTNQEALLMKAAEVGEHSISIFGIESVAIPVPIPEEFLPEGYSKDELVAAVIAALPNAEEVAF